MVWPDRSKDALYWFYSPKGYVPSDTIYCLDMKWIALDREALMGELISHNLVIIGLMDRERFNEWYKKAGF